MPKLLKTILILVGGVLLLLTCIYGASLAPSGQRRVSRLENISGIPYSQVNGASHVDEPLAHADIYLNQPVFAKTLILAVDFIPTNINTLALGVRENSFWLSYHQLPICCGQNQRSMTPIHSVVSIPLADKLQESDQSIDLMFFAEGQDPQWELVQITAEVKPVLPTWAQTKDYALSILKRERAL